MKPLFLLLAIHFAFVGQAAAADCEPEQRCRLPSNLKQEILGYQNLVDSIIQETTTGKYAGKFYQDLAAFVDKFGHRLAGTDNLQNSIDYIAKNTESKGLKVHQEPVVIPTWIRGKESARLISPRETDLNILGLAYSAGTGPDGITADVIAVSDFDELEKKGKQVAGKIVLFNAPYIAYGSTVEYRVYGPEKASKLGAVAVLVRSVTPFSINSPHTGTTRFRTAKAIPAACVTLEDADMMARMLEAGEKVTVNLNMGAKIGPDGMSNNLIFDFVGTQPNHYVTVSGHIDSWDVGQGALDDGVGAFLGLHSLLLLKHMNVTTPRRTIRGIMWTGEEEGLLGALTYLKEHKNELKNWTAAMESDGGLYKPLGFSFNGTEEAYCIMKEITSLFMELEATTVKKNPYVGSDIEIFQEHGVPLIDPLHGKSNYFWFHHTNGDTMRTLNSTDMDKNLAMFAATSYILANLTVPLPRKGQTLWNPKHKKIPNMHDNSA